MIFNIESIINMESQKVMSNGNSTTVMEGQAKTLIVNRKSIEVNGSKSNKNTNHEQSNNI
jgi:hypothetical protein